jgi:hypothetical protein
MTGADLAAEYEAALCATSDADLAQLREAGVGESALALVKPAVAPIVVRRSDLSFEPDPDGGTAFILPVRVEQPLSPEAADPEFALLEGPIVDLVAFSVRFPDRWATRCGNATWLGCVEAQYMGPDAVPVWRRPLDWLANDCRGLVLLTRDRRERYRVLTWLDTILAEDEDHAADLRELLAQPWPAPPVLVRQGQRNAA